MNERPTSMGRCRICYKFTQVDESRTCKKCLRPHDKNQWRLGLSRDVIQRINRSGIYLIHAVGIGKYKIGKTTNLHKRIHEINHQYPIEMRVLKFWTTDSLTEFESGLHNMFILYKLGNTDWFNFPENVAYRLSRQSSDKLWKMINKGERLG